MAKVRLQHRRGTSAQWVAANPVLAVGEMAFETDTGRLKIGDGTKSYVALGWTATMVEIEDVNIAVNAVETVTALFNQTTSLKAIAEVSAIEASESALAAFNSQAAAFNSETESASNSQVASTKALEAADSALSASNSAVLAAFEAQNADRAKLWISNSLPEGITEGDFWVNNQEVV